jgi:uncharacterized membrane protein
MSLNIEPGVYTAMLAMAAVTLFMRLAGYWIVGRFSLTPRLRRGLEALPVAIFSASIIPLAVMGGPAGWIATPLVAALMFLTGREAVALLLGIAAAAFIRSLGF